MKTLVTRFASSMVIHAVLAMLLVALVTPCVHGQYRLTKLLDDQVAIPGGTGNFIGFTDVAYDGRVVAMRGWGNNGPQGIYLWKDGTLSKVVDKSTNVPGSNALFSLFGEFSLDGGHVAFQGLVGSPTNITQEGVYSTLGGALQRVADRNTFIPESNVRFQNLTSLHDLSLDGDDVVFTASGHGREGVYRKSGDSLSIVADRFTPIAGSTDDITFFDVMDASERQVVVRGDAGLYTTHGAPAGQLRTVYAFGTPLPGLTNPLITTSPNTVGIDGSDIAFMATDANSRNGLYLQRNGAIGPIVTHDMTSPVNGANFTRLLGFYSLSGGEVAFWGESGNVKGVYVSRNGVMTNVINSNTLIGGKTIDSLGVSQESLKHGRLVMDVEFTDGTGALYLAERLTPAAGPSRSTFSTGIDGQINGSTITGNGTTLTVLKNAATNADRRAVIEFDLSALPASATINTAELEITTGSVAAGSSLAIFGYEGDSGLRAADFARRDYFLGESPILTSSTTRRFHLDGAAVQSILEDSSRDVLGLAIMGGYEESHVVFSAMEAGLAARPKLYISYTGPSPADFNNDGIVDGADLERWQSAFGASATTTSPGNADGDSDVDGADFLVWQRAVSTASVATVATPEPSCALLMMGAAVAWRRAARRRGRAR